VLVVKIVQHNCLKWCFNFYYGASYHGKIISSRSGVHSGDSINSYYVNDKA